MDQHCKGREKRGMIFIAATSIAGSNVLAVTKELGITSRNCHVPSFTQYPECSYHRIISSPDPRRAMPSVPHSSGWVVSLRMNSPCYIPYPPSANVNTSLFASSGECSSVLPTGLSPHRHTSEIWFEIEAFRALDFQRSEGSTEVTGSTALHQLSPRRRRWVERVKYLAMSWLLLVVTESLCEVTNTGRPLGP